MAKRPASEPSTTAESSTTREWRQRLGIPAAVFVVSAVVYVIAAGPQRFEPTADNHFVHLANSWLSGELSVVGNRPPGTNDWACFDTVERTLCPAGQFSFPERVQDRYRWYVSFPPFPAVVMLPFVAIWGTAVPDRLIWSILAGLGPALLFVFLRHLSRAGYNERRTWENLVLTALFAFGTVYFFTAVQGAVWFAAHVVASALLPLYLLFGLEGRRPLLAGLVLALSFMTRTTTLFLAGYFVIEALRYARASDAPMPGDDALVWKRAWVWLKGVRLSPFVRAMVLFGIPIAVVGSIAAIHNQARFDDPFEFGHTYLQIKWRPRIERWGLFNYHYLAKNLAVFLASLPWLSASYPYITVSRHGLALWVTTPHLVLSAFPRVVRVTTIALFAGVIPVLLLNLMYQNSGWVQFGYRFALDYMPLLFALIAIGRRRIGPVFLLLAIYAVAINTFGALTFDRSWQYYDQDSTQNVVFQPD